jgi:hypothetical protein
MKNSVMKLNMTPISENATGNFSKLGTLLLAKYVWDIFNSGIFDPLFIGIPAIESARS